MAIPNKDLKNLMEQVNKYKGDPNKINFLNLRDALDQYIKSDNDLTIQINGESLGELCLDETKGWVSIPTFLELTKKKHEDKKSLTKLMKIANLKDSWFRGEKEKLNEIYTLSISNGTAPDEIRQRYQPPNQKKESVTENDIINLINETLPRPNDPKSRERIEQLFGADINNKIRFIKKFKELLSEQFQHSPPSYEDIKSFVEFGQQYQILDLNHDLYLGRAGEEKNRLLLEHYLDTIYTHDDKRGANTSPQSIDTIKKFITLLAGDHPFTPDVQDQLRSLISSSKGERREDLRLIYETLKASVTTLPEPPPPAPTPPVHSPEAVTAFFDAKTKQSAKGTDAKSEKEPAKPSSNLDRGDSKETKDEGPKAFK